MASVRDRVSSSTARMVVLVGVMLGLLAVLWHRREIVFPPRPEPPPTQEQIAKAYRPFLPEDEFSEPDFGEGTRLSLTNDPEEAGAQALAEARGADAAVRRQFQAAVDKQTSTAPTLPTLTSQTARDVNEAYYQFRLRELEAYRKVTADTGEAKTLGEEFLAAYVERACSRGMYESAWQLIERADRAIAAGSNDPFLRMCRAFLAWDYTGHDHGAFEKEMKVLLPELTASQYPAAVRTHARTWLNEAYRHQHPGSLSPRWNANVVAIVRWLEEDSRDPALRRALATRLLWHWNNCRPEEQAILVAALFESETIDPWLTHMLAGRHYVKVAWRYRGGGYAHTVTKAGWEGFEKYCTIAASHLRYAWSLAPDLPDAAAEMVTVAMAGYAQQRSLGNFLAQGTFRTESPYQWFLRSVEAQFDCHEAYWALLNELRPRWGGSIEEQMQFILSCVESERFDTYVPYLALEMLLDIEKSEFSQVGWTMQTAGGVQIVDRFLNLREAYRQKHPQERLFGDGAYYRTLIAMLLERLELHEDALAEARSTEMKFSQRLLQADGRLGAYSWYRLSLAQGANRDRVLAFDAKLRTPWTAEMPLSRLEELEQERRALGELADPEDRWQQRYFEHVDRMLAQLQTFASGEWLTLEFDKDLTGWEAYADEVTPDPEGRGVTVSRRGGFSHLARVRLLAQFAPPLQVEVDLEVQEPLPYLTQVGINYYAAEDATGPMPNWDADQPFWGIWTTSGSDMKRVDQCTRSEETPDVANFVLKTAGSHRIDLRIWDDAFEGRTGSVCDLISLPKPVVTNGYLAIGEYLPLRTESAKLNSAGSFRISHLRVRRLAAPKPPGLTQPLAVRREYWSARLAENPDDVPAQEQLAWLRLEEGDFEGALQAAEEFLKQPDPLLSALVLKGRAQTLLHRPAEALATLREANNQQLVHAHVYPYLAELYAAADDPAVRNEEEAQRYVEVGVRLSPASDPIPIAARAVCMALRGEYSTAVELNAQAMELAGDAMRAELERRQKLYLAGKRFVFP